MYLGSQKRIPVRLIHERLPDAIIEERRQKAKATAKKIGTWRIECVLCQFYARLLALLLFQWLVMPYRWTNAGELSLPKALLYLKGKAHKLVTAFTQDWQQMDDLFLRLPCLI